MRIHKAIWKIAILISLFGLISCETVPKNITINPKLADAIKDGVAEEALLLDKDGNIFLADKEGNVIPSCKERSKSDNPCHGVKNGKLISIQTVTITEWKINPFCRTFTIGGTEIERCHRGDVQ